MRRLLGGEEREIVFEESNIFLGLLIVNGISAVITIIIFVLPIFLKSNKNPNHFESMNVLISSLFHSIGYAIEYFMQNKTVRDYDFICQAQSFLEVTFSLSMDLWVCFLSLRNFKIYIKEKDISAEMTNKKRRLKFELLYLAIGYLFPIILSVIFCSLKIFGTSKINCWFRTDDYDYCWILFSFRLIALIIIFIYFVKLLKGLYEDTAKLSIKLFFASKIASYPIIQCISIISSVLYTIWDTALKNEDKEPPQGVADFNLLVCGIVGLLYSGTYLLLDVIFTGIDTIVSETNENEPRKPSLFLDDGDIENYDKSKIELSQE